MQRPPPPTDPRLRRKSLEAQTHDLGELPEILLPGELLAAFRRLLAQPGGRLPMLPEMAIRLMRLTSEPNVKVDDIVKLLERDPALAARILAVSNSARYRGLVAVTSLKRAVVVLGLGQTRDLLFEIVSASTIFRIPHYSEAARNLRLHSRVAAYLAREVSRLAGFDPELAFLAGLLHDVGRALLLFTAAASAKRGEPPPALEDLATAIDQDHAEAGAAAAIHWKLPQPLVDAVLRHHHPSAGDPHQLAAYCANRICQHLGAGVPTQPLGAQDRPFFEAAKLDPDRVTKLVELAQVLASEGDQLA